MASFFFEEKTLVVAVSSPDNGFWVTQLGVPLTEKLFPNFWKEFLSAFRADNPFDEAASRDFFLSLKKEDDWVFLSPFFKDPVVDGSFLPSKFHFPGIRMLEHLYFKGEPVKKEGELYEFFDTDAINFFYSLWCFRRDFKASGELLLSKKDGYVFWDGQDFRVTKKPPMVVNAVDIKVDVEFTEDLIIEGDLNTESEESISITSEGFVEIRGNCNKVVVIARDVRVTGECRDSDIQADNFIVAGSFHHCELSVTGYLFAEGDLETCECEAEQGIFVGGTLCDGTLTSCGLIHLAGKNKVSEQGGGRLNLKRNRRLEREIFKKNHTLKKVIYRQQQVTALLTPIVDKDSRERNFREKEFMLELQFELDELQEEQEKLEHEIRPLKAAFDFQRTNTMIHIKQDAGAVNVNRQVDGIGMLEQIDRTVNFYLIPFIK